MEYEINEPRRLGGVIRELRKERAMTQAELALRAGVSRGYLVRLERGHPTAEIDAVLRVLRPLGARLLIGQEIAPSEVEKELQVQWERLING
ncbi:MAG: helix-turn-helix domain-containing protein [Actinomycetota bacterium]|nr:helix-turn-helix domain-containing protein [Actinomycetota bacterium]